MPHIGLIVTPERSLRSRLHRLLSEQNYLILDAPDRDSALLLLLEERIDFVVIDLDLEDRSGFDLLDRVHKHHPDTLALTIGSSDRALMTMATTIEAVQHGAVDHFERPLSEDRLLKAVQRLVAIRDLSANLAILREESGKEYDLTSALVGHSHAMQEIYKLIGSLTRSRVTILLTGETGSGKERLARALHFNSPWKDEPFVAVNCTALTETLLESELFGHVRGSFTGAVQDKRGKFELAGEGTLFLDEIGELTPHLQVKLLRVLQEREFEPVGGEKTLKLRARLLTATNRDLAEEVRRGRFREDLYYRLNVVSIHVPPLRERKEDLMQLVPHLLKQINLELHTSVTKLLAVTLEKIKAYDWPGNVRELRNALTRGVVLAKGEIVEDSVFDLGPTGLHAHELTDSVYTLAVPGYRDWRVPLDAVERAHVRHVLEQTAGNKRMAARILDISPATLRSKLGVRIESDHRG